MRGSILTSGGLKRTFSSADFVPKNYTVFDVGWNAYRVVFSTHYDKQRADICKVLTMLEYDKWTRAKRGK